MSAPAAALSFPVKLLAFKARAFSLMFLKKALKWKGLKLSIYLGEGLSSYLSFLIMPQKEHGAAISNSGGDSGGLGSAGGGRGLQLLDLLLPGSPHTPPPAPVCS